MHSKRTLIKRRTEDVARSTYVPSRSFSSYLSSKDGEDLSSFLSRFVLFLDSFSLSRFPKKGIFKLCCPGVELKYSGWLLWNLDDVVCTLVNPLNHFLNCFTRSIFIFFSNLRQVS